MAQTNRHKGVSHHRTNDNAEEARFARAWVVENAVCKTLAYLLAPASADIHNPPTPSDRDCQVAATIIQWLGSPVGQEFLREMGYARVSMAADIRHAAEIRQLKDQIRSKEKVIDAVRAAIRKLEE